MKGERQQRAAGETLERWLAGRENHSGDCSLRIAPMVRYGFFSRRIGLLLHISVVSPARGCIREKIGCFLISRARFVVFIGAQNQASSVFCVAFTETLARALLTRSSEKS
ncbi:hypothetical protein DSECCO2_97910 [anaerobic digester metagenome]|jgi:hypothetical protein